MKGRTCVWRITASASRNLYPTRGAWDCGSWPSAPISLVAGSIFGPRRKAERSSPVTCPRRSKIASHAVSQQKRKIFLVDDHPLVRDGLANLIHQQSDLVVCGQADDALEACPK